MKNLARTTLVLMTGWLNLQGAAPQNDGFPYALRLYDETRGFVSLDEATAETSEPAHGGHPGLRSVWWTWTPAVTGDYRLSVEGATNALLVGALYTGDSVDALTEVATVVRPADGPPLAFTDIHVSKNRQFRVALAAADGGADPARLFLIQKLPPPANDNFADATAISAVPLPKPDIYPLNASRVDLTWASVEPGEGGPTDDPPKRSVWFTWTAPLDGDCLLDVNTPGRALAAVYTGDTLPALHLESSLANDNPPGHAVALFRARQGVAYRLMMGAVTATPERVGGTWRLFYAPTNDDFADRRVVALTNGTTTVTVWTTGATRESGEPPIGDGGSVWFELVTSVAGAYEVESYAYSPQQTLAVFRGETLATLSLVTGSAPSAETAKVRFAAAAGEHLTLAVSDSKTSNYWGTYCDIRRAPRYDPVPVPSVSIGYIPVGPPLSLVPTNRLALRFAVTPLRYYDVETSDDLLHWRRLHQVLIKTIEAVVDLGNGEPPGNFLRVVVPD